MQNQEQRSRDRQTVSVFVNQEFGEEDTQLGMSVDLSPSGMSLITLQRTKPPAGRHAWLKFWLPGSDTLVKALAEVVHRHDDGEVERYGMRFKYMFPDQRLLLERYLSASGASA